jgi:hypothetical protein
MNKPSKQFIIRGAIAIGIVAILLTVQTSWFQSLINKNPSKDAYATDLTVGDIINKDSNGNGVPDWEEKLWGLDPTVLYTNGTPNNQIIEEKKRALGVSGTVDEQSLNETDKLSRELFTLATALGQSGEVDSATLEQIAATFGSSIDTERVTNQYSVKDIQTVKTTTQFLTTYTAQLRKILDRYDQNQSDIDVVITALETGDDSGLSSLTATKTQYRALARELAAIPVPIGVAAYHLNMINGIAGIADSFTFIQELSENGIGALVGVAIYRQYSTLFDTAVFDMAQYLTDYGILSS